MNTKSKPSSTSDSDEKFLIHELAARANASIRTIRYYTEEGLLPPPDVSSKYALYTQAHVDRLLLITQMKDRFLPLREIRALLSTLSDAEVRTQLAQPAGGRLAVAGASVAAGAPGAGLGGEGEAETVPRSEDLAKAARIPVSSQPAAPGKTSGSAALEYINRLLGEKPGTAPSRPLTSHSQPAGTPPSAPYEPSPGYVPAAEANSQGEIWRRIELVPGLELHVHERFDPSAESRIQQIVFLSRKLFRTSHTK